MKIQFKLAIKKIKVYESAILPANYATYDNDCTLEETKLENTISSLNKLDFDIFLLVYYSHRDFALSFFEDYNDKVYDNFDAVGSYCRIAFVIKKTCFNKDPYNRIQFLQSLQ